MKSFSKMSKRPYSGGKISKRPMKKRVTVSGTKVRKAQSRAVQAKLQSIEHKFFTSSIINVAISQNVTMTGIFNDPATGGIFTPTTGDDNNSRDGRRAVVDEFTIRGSVLFPSVEAINDVELNQVVKLALIQDTSPEGNLATTSDIFTNATGSIYGNISALRNPNNVLRFKVLKTKTIVKPVGGMVVMPKALPAAATDREFSWPSKVVPFEFNVKLKKPVTVQFNATNNNTIASIEKNSFHFAAWTGGDDNTLGITTRMDCNLTYNARTRFYS